MILNLPRFVREEEPYWKELDHVLTRLHVEPELRLTLEEAQRMHYLYERAAAALVQLDDFTDVAVKRSVESLVARAYAELNESRSQESERWRWREWAVRPAQAVRRRAKALALSAMLTVLGCLAGAFAMWADESNRALLMPFTHLQVSPRERVAAEESAKSGGVRGHEAEFSASLMTHNIRVSLLTLSLGMTYGIGTGGFLFGNGVLLGAVSADYIRQGYSAFLFGWLLPHGSVEIPAILIAGQAGFVLAGALIGWRRPIPRRLRLRSVWDDVLSLVAAIAVLLVWAGIVEAFISQYHSPVLPYSLKIAFGATELTALVAYLCLAGRRGQDRAA